MALLNTKQDKKEFLKWIEALRSGKYPQGKNSLQSAKGYCCLGVACVILIPKNKLVIGSDNRLRYSFPYQQIHAPDWLKQINDNFMLHSSRVIQSFRSLFELNDKLNYTFTQIADILMETYKEELDAIKD